MKIRDFLAHNRELHLVSHYNERQRVFVAKNKLTGDEQTYFTEQDKLGNSPKTYDYFGPESIAPMLEK
jgi:hypothetical protein